MSWFSFLIMNKLQDIWTTSIATIFSMNIPLLLDDHAFAVSIATLQS